MSTPTNTTLAKTLIGAFLVLGLLGIVTSLWTGFRDRVATENCQGITLVVNESTQAVCAKLKADRNEFLALKEAAKKMNGKAVAGVEIVIKRDTVYKTITEVVTVTDSTGARVATLADTTADYEVTIQAHAPPTGNLRLGYNVVTPERKVEVGFVKAPGGVYAVVSGRGVTTTKSFYAPEKEKPLTAWVGAGVSGNPLVPLPIAEVRGSVFMALDYRISSAWSTSIEAGRDDRLYAGLRVKRKLW